jgi:ABC-type Fe3+ transport system permease subunit
MSEIFNRYATPFTTGLFLVSLISGIALFFHVGGAAFHGMHEWLSMVLILPFVLHLWRNWWAFTAYLKQPPMAIALVASLVMALAFVIPTLGGDQHSGPPQRVLFQAFENGTITQIAPLFGHTAESLTTVLKEAGYTVTSADQRIAEIAKASGKAPFDLVRVVASAKR